MRLWFILAAMMGPGFFRRFDFMDSVLARKSEIFIAGLRLRRSAQGDRM